MAGPESHASLTANEAAYRALFHAVRDPCLLTRADGRIEEVNAAAADLLGAFPAVLRGKPLAAFVDRPDRSLFRRTVRRVTADERHAFLLLGFRHRSERIVPAAVECLAHEDAAGCIARLLWVAHPLDAPGGVAGPDEILEEFVRVRTAALREARRALEREHATLRDAVDGVPFGVLVLEAASREVVVANRALLGMLGLAHYDRSRLRAANGDLLDMVDWPVDRAARTRLPVLDVRVTLQRPDGGLSELLASAEPIVVDGRMRAVVGTFVDLGARSARDRADAEFLTNAAHNLRNPLTVISTAVEILQGGAKDEPAERDRFLEHIEREVAKMLQLTRSLLTLAQADATRQPPRRRPVRAEDLLRSVAGGIELQENVELVINVPADLVAFTDEGLLEQALANLAENAARHTRAGFILLEGEGAAGGVRFRVTDTGEGIPDAGEDVFRRFSRRESAGQGFGFGLAIVQRIADALSAEVELESEVGVGTSVSLLVPERRGE